MLFSLFGEIALAAIGLLYVIDCYFDSCINLMEQMKNNDDEKEEDKKVLEAIKHMYS